MIKERFISLNIADRVLREHPEIELSREKLSDEQVVEYCNQLAKLAPERAQLGYLLYRGTEQIRARKENRKKPEEYKQVPLEKEILAIKKGRIEQLLKKPPVEHPQEQDRLQLVEDQIKTLVSYPQVVERYRKEFVQKIRTLQSVSEIEKLRKYKENLKETEFSAVDEKILSHNKARIAAAKERIAILEKNPAVLNEERRRELIGYRRQLKRQGFVETLQVKKLVDELAARVRSGKPLLLWGHTGTGKTETFRHLSWKLFNKEPEMFSGSEEITHYDLFGKTQLKPEGSYFQGGPAVKAIQEGRPLLIDEVDLVPHAIIGRLQDLLTRRPGKTITIQENSNEEIKIPEGFIVLATGNIRSSKYRREDLDPAFLRRFWQTELKYLPLNETFDILLAALIDRRGALNIGSHQNIEDLKNLCQAAKFVQDVFTGEKTDFLGEGADASRGIGATLEKATLSIGDLLTIIEQWKAKNFTHPLEDFILSEFIRSQTVRRDQLNLVKIFCLHGFFKNKKTEDFGISGLTEEKLLAYRAEKKP